MSGIFSLDDFRHDLRGDRRKENAVAKMAGGYVIAGRGCWAENRQCVGSPGAQPGPVFENLRIAEFGNHGDCGAVQTLNRGDVGALVESGFFHRGADDDSSVAARDQVNLW